MAKRDEPRSRRQRSESSTSASRARPRRSRSRSRSRSGSRKPKRRILRSPSSGVGRRKERSRSRGRAEEKTTSTRGDGKKPKVRSESPRSQGKKKQGRDKEKKAREPQAAAPAEGRGDREKGRDKDSKKDKKKVEKKGEKIDEKKRKPSAASPGKKDGRRSASPRRKAAKTAESPPLSAVAADVGKATSATTGSSSVGARSANGAPVAAANGAAVAKAPRAPLGDLAELQRGLEKERSMLQLFVLKAKQEHEEQKETKDKKERREKEYFKAEFFGEPCGPRSQFILEDELGRGVFSTVYKCRDMGVSGKEYAVKFIRANPMLRKATEKEIRLMRRLRNEASVKDPEGVRCFLALAGPESFEYKGHLALVFHLQRCDMRTALQKYGQGQGLPLALVRNYCRDLFHALRALSQVNIIHSDVKPDNLLMSVDKTSVKLSDFGSAMAVDERIRTDYLQPRFYRAPEVILGHTYTTQVDVWSGGATIFELATGRFLFEGETNNGMLHEFLKTCGAFSKSFATTGDFAGKHFNPQGDFKLKESSTEQVLPASTFKKPSQPLSKLMLEAMKKPPAGVEAAAHLASVRQFADVLAKAVVPDPSERSTPDAILAHSFLQKRGGTPGGR